MKALLNIIDKIEYNFDKAAARLSKRCPKLFFVFAFIGAPLFVLSLVCAGTIIIVFPISQLLGRM